MVYKGNGAENRKGDRDTRESHRIEPDRSVSYVANRTERRIGCGYRRTD
jgi:hypothetical protein